MEETIGGCGTDLDDCRHFEGFGDRITCALIANEQLSARYNHRELQQVLALIPWDCIRCAESIAKHLIILINSQEYCIAAISFQHLRPAEERVVMPVPGAADDHAFA